MAITRNCAHVEMEPISQLAQQAFHIPLPLPIKRCTPHFIPMPSTLNLHEEKDTGEIKK
jgi:hypothetical protein